MTSLLTTLPGSLYTGYRKRFQDHSPFPSSVLACAYGLRLRHYLLCYHAHHDPAKGEADQVESGDRRLADVSYHLYSQVNVFRQEESLEEP